MVNAGLGMFLKSHLKQALFIMTASLDSKWHPTLTDPFDFFGHNAKLGDRQTLMTLFCLDLERALPVVQEMKSHSEMLSLGVAEVKQVYSKVVKKRYEVPWFVVSLSSLLCGIC